MAWRENDGDYKILLRKTKNRMKTSKGYHIRTVMSKIKADPGGLKEEKEMQMESQAVAGSDEMTIARSQDMTIAWSDDMSIAGLQVMTIAWSDDMTIVGSNDMN